MQVPEKKRFSGLGLYPCQDAHKPHNRAVEIRFYRGLGRTLFMGVSVAAPIQNAGRFLNGEWAGICRQVRDRVCFRKAHFASKCHLRPLEHWTKEHKTLADMNEAARGGERIGD